MINYRKIEDRTPDLQYKKLLEHVMTKGKKFMPIHGEETRSFKGYPMRFDMRNGFPAITERDVSGGMFHGGLGEIIGFMNGARTLDELEKFGCPKIFWERWVTKEKCEQFGLSEGDLGPGSYGAAFANFPTNIEGKTFHQILNLVNQIKEMSYLRTHFVSPWIPYLTCAKNEEFPRKVVVAPCHGWFAIHVYQEDRTIEIHHIQRSADIPVGLTINLMEYATVGMMVSDVTGYEFTEMIYYIMDAHIYESQFPFVEELLSRETRVFPKVEIINPRENILDFRPDDFKMTEYNPNPRMRIPTPV